jgi:hypothetical protein
MPRLQRANHKPLATAPSDPLPNLHVRLPAVERQMASWSGRADGWVVAAQALATSRSQARRHGPEYVSDRLVRELAIPSVRLGDEPANEARDVTGTHGDEHFPRPPALDDRVLVGVM